MLTPDIIYEDEQLIAINKPHGLLVHKTRIAKDATEFALQLVRDHIGQQVYPAHRLDRKTSGVLLFSKSASVNRTIQALFRDRKVYKTYVAIVRGLTDESGIIDYALSEEKKAAKDAVTLYKTLCQFEIAEPLGKFQTSRYSLVELKPETGRFHQLRKHMAHIFHPIIGDRPHGCNKQNRMWKERFGMDKMLLHASRLELQLESGKTIKIEATQSNTFQQSLAFLIRKNVLS